MWEEYLRRSEVCRGRRLGEQKAQGQCHSVRVACYVTLQAGGDRADHKWESDSYNEETQCWRRVKKIFQSVAAGPGWVWWLVSTEQCGWLPGSGQERSAGLQSTLTVCLWDTNTGLDWESEARMAANSEAEFRMMFLLNNMDINQEGQLSSEDRLFSSGTPRYQSEHAQVNKA